MTTSGPARFTCSIVQRVSVLDVEPEVYVVPELDPLPAVGQEA